MSGKLSLIRGGGETVRDVPPLGQILRDHDWIDQTRLDDALARQPMSGQRLGDVLVATGAVSAEQIARALAEQWGLGFVDLARDPGDCAALIAGLDADTCLAHRLLPWRKLGALVTYVTDNPAGAANGLAALGAGPMAFVGVVTPGALDDAFALALGPRLVAHAATRVAAGVSVRTLGPARGIVGALILAGAIALALGGDAVLGCAVAGLLLVNGATTGLRLAALIASLRTPDAPAQMPPDMVRLADRRPLPKITLLVPLFREAGMIGRVVAALEEIDYPRELMDVKLLLEAVDTETIAAARASALPGWIAVLVVPDGAPRTKPRAMNFALDFCRGEIVGILDAEDRACPQQLRKVAEHLRHAPLEVACVQCQLSYFNARENWITRCFHLEYGIWFEVLLRGFQRLGLPIPLGGTSLYFRRSALRALGGWDAHNVTEDADLGMRLARRGLRCAVLESVTMEEANCRAWPWIRQRSRWLKGYLLTWLSHMRNPLALWRDLGTVGFLGFNVLFLGAAVSYLAMPLFWLSLALWAWSGQSLWGDHVPGWLLWPLAVSLAGGQAIMLGCAWLAMRRRGAVDLMWWVPVLPVYWTLGALAAWKAVVELVTAPYYWDKTRHGISRFAVPQGPAAAALAPAAPALRAAPILTKIS